jgi:L-lactate utilization protein LutC
MNILDRLLASLGFSSKDAKAESESKFKPVEKLPLDEEFAINFKDNGGKFIYCENKTDLKESYISILDENDWYSSKIGSKNNELLEQFNKYKNLSVAEFGNEDLLLTDCEYLISNTGAILISSQQIGEKKLEELPYDIIVFAKTSQLIETISIGLQKINIEHKSNIPTNIRSLKTFKEKEDDDFMSYGSVSKNVYLLLLEDL